MIRSMKSSSSSPKLPRLRSSTLSSQIDTTHQIALANLNRSYQRLGGRRTSHEQGRYCYIPFYTEVEPCSDKALISTVLCRCRFFRARSRSIPLNLPVQSAARTLRLWRNAGGRRPRQFLHKLEILKFHNESALVGVEKPVDFRLADWLSKGDAGELQSSPLSFEGSRSECPVTHVGAQRLVFDPGS
jgi:hypothetical protein